MDEESGVVGMDSGEGISGELCGWTSVMEKDSVTSALSPSELDEETAAQVCEVEDDDESGEDMPGGISPGGDIPGGADIPGP